MYIDLHCHTKREKKGDSEKRNVTAARFAEALRNKGVSIVAITNHNDFDRKQYDEFCYELKDDKIQVWPGVELDVLGKENNRCHLLVVANPTQVDLFKERVDSLIECHNNVTRDSFAIRISMLPQCFSDLDVMLIAHYKKNPSFSDQDIEYLTDQFKCIENHLPIYLEASQLRGAGILCAKKLHGFCGSDVQNWDEYEKLELPELKMAIKDFNTFKLLIRKDPNVIKTFLDEVGNEKINVHPYEDWFMNFDLYNDVNLVFGDKGTGKSILLDAIKKYYETKGITDISYYSGQTKEEQFDKLIKRNLVDSDFDIFGINDFSDDFKYLTNWKESKITQIKSYVDWQKTIQTSKLAQKFGFRDAEFIEDIEENTIQTANKFYERVKKDEEYYKANLGDYLNSDNKVRFLKLFSELLTSAKNTYVKRWIEVKALELEKFTISTMKELLKNHSGVNPKPNNTGLYDLYKELKNINKKSKNLLQLIKEKQEVNLEPIGYLENKGKISIKSIYLLDPNETNVKKLSNAKKEDLKNIVKCLKNIEKYSFSVDVSKKISDFSGLCTDDNVTSLRDFLQAKFIVVDEQGHEYNPSNGEKAILLLSRTIISNDYSVYILDEPELGLGNKYINDYVVPRLNALAKMNKKIIISTHDANIAVRTLPLQSIYREYCGNNQYKTFLGNPFIDTLVNVENNEEKYSWTEKCIEQLEGGREAFMERSDVYEL